jgi:hypothetical protein
MATSGLASRLHTHAYDDHDHPEHHHGLTAHEHHTAPARPDAAPRRLEDCDPGQHAVPFAFMFAAPAPPPALAAEVLDLLTTAAPAPRIGAAGRHADVRVHGPPARTQAPPRAPPLLAHA